MILTYPFLVIASICLWIVNLFAVPVIVLFADKDGWLPWYLNWFQTCDNSLYGDDGWKQQRPYWNTRKGMALWLWRNPCQGFDYFLKAKKLTGKKYIFGNTNIKDRENAVGGWYLVYQNGYFELRCITRNKLAAFAIPFFWFEVFVGLPCYYFLSVEILLVVSDFCASALFMLLAFFFRDQCVIMNLGWGLMDENPVNKGNFSFTPFRVGRFYR